MSGLVGMDDLTAWRITLVGSLYAVLVGAVVSRRPWYQAWLRRPTGARAILKMLLLLALIFSGLWWSPAMPVTMFFMGTVWLGPDSPMLK